MPVDTRHADYEKALPDWTLCRDVVGGERKVKERTIDYLPQPTGMTQEEYEQYLVRAQFYGATGKTVQAMTGAIFRREPAFKLPAATEYLRLDADGRGTPLGQFAKALTTEVCAMGRVGLLVDYPQVPLATSLAEERQLQARAHLYTYEAENIVNWRYEKVGAAYILSLLVLAEVDAQPKAEDPFAVEQKDRRRVLWLNGGRLQVDVWEVRTKTNGDKDWVLVGTTLPALPGGQPLDFIPFHFVGPDNLNAAVDQSPVIDLARVNVGHYRNSADYEEALFLLGQPTPYITGLSAEWADKHGASMRIGSRTAWLLPTGADAGLLELTSDLGALKGAMEGKEHQMATLGARLFEAREGNPEAEGTIRARQSGESSLIASIASNVSRALETAINWCGLWMKAAGEAEVVFNENFFAGQLDSAKLDSLIRAWQAGAITKRTLFEQLLSGEVIADGTEYEEYADELENEAPTLPGPLDENGDPVDEEGEEEDDEDQAA
jgi:hypothetical protein